MFEYNEEIEVRDCNQGQWSKYLFRAFVDDKYYVAPTKNTHHPLVPWNQARAIPKRIPHTLETFPKGCVLIRGTKGHCPEFTKLVTEWAAGGVQLNDTFHSWQNLKKHGFQLSIDNGKTWVPAYQEAEPVEVINHTLWHIKVRKPGGSTPDHMLYHWRIISTANPDTLFRSDKGYPNRGTAIERAKDMAATLSLRITQVID